METGSTTEAERQQRYLAKIEANIETRQRFSLFAQAAALSPTQWLRVAYDGIDCDTVDNAGSKL